MRRVARESVEEYYFHLQHPFFCAEFRLSHCSPPVRSQDRRRRRHRHHLQRARITSFMTHHLLRRKYGNLLIDLRTRAKVERIDQQYEKERVSSS